ncbi:MAG: filamentous hemagglutinin N-terminal domain-containing protein, partial [Burkholderiales bacterium]|nr:filamentous hemagglutinin N-terminal domain-containing protein [Burkholderiales bacterium]
MRPFRLAPLAVAIAAAFATSESFALPTDPQIRAGQGAVTSPGVKSVVVRQDSARLAIDWQSFGIAAGESVRFVQPGASSIALNRVLGNSRSEIFGNLSANGQVFLINPNGVLFGRTAQVDVGGLVASTLDISTSDFMAGRTTFSGASAGAVINQGRLSAASGGYVALLGPVVRNEGVIEARMGTVALAAGDQVTLNLGGNSLVGLSVDRGVVGALAENQQLIQAEGGRVLLSARAADDVIRAVVNNTGVIEANSVSNINGLVRLEGLGASTVLASGTLRARGEEAGETGGRVEMLGERVGLLSGALIDASGSAGGGVVLVGGDFQGKNPDVRNAVRTYVGPDAAIRADAIERGNGGKVVVWSDDVTRFYGSISARGGAKSGDGGFAEVSGKGDLVYRGNVSLSAPNGRGGTLLLDPTNIDLVAAGGDLDGFLPDVFAADAGSTLTVGALTGIASGTILLEATNNVNFGLDVTLQAGVNLTVTPNSDAAGGGAFNLSANLSANVLNVNGPLNHTAGTLTAASGGIGGLYDYGSAGALTINGGTLTLNAGMNWTGAGGISGVGVAPTLAIPAGQTLSMTG